MRTTLFLLTLLSLASCGIFRQKKEDIAATVTSDSLAMIDTRVNWKDSFRFQDSTGTVDIIAIGFRNITIDKDGNISAEGENGQLQVNRKDSNKKAAGDKDSTATEKKLIAVSDSSHTTKKKEYEYKATPDTGFNFWWTAILGVVILAVVWLFLQKFDFNKWFK